MKMIFAIVNNDDAQAVMGAITKSGYSVTKLSTTGGFSKEGNTTFLIGVDDDKVDAVIKIVETQSSKRTVKTRETCAYGDNIDNVTVGGAVVFVANVERFEKL